MIVQPAFSALTSIKQGFRTDSVWFVTRVDSLLGLATLGWTIYIVWSRPHDFSVVGSTLITRWHQWYFSKESSGTHSDPKFGRRGEGVIYIDDRKKRFRNGIPACVLLRKNFRDSVPLQECSWVVPILYFTFSIVSDVFKVCGVWGDCMYSGDSSSWNKVLNENYVNTRQWATLQRVGSVLNTAQNSLQYRSAVNFSGQVIEVCNRLVAWQLPT
jgi:hypothetical protein